MRLSYLHDGISYTGKMLLYWTRPQDAVKFQNDQTNVDLYLTALRFDGLWLHDNLMLSE